jgi:two-component system NarL family sensor kinase
MTGDAEQLVAQPQTAGRFRSSARAQWRALGPFGRVALFGLAISVAIAVVIGSSIPRVLERGLIDAHLQTFIAAVDNLVDQGLLLDLEDPTAGERLDDVVRNQLIGVDVARVKLWYPGGLVVYSDATELIGMTFEPSEHLAAAFDGTAHAGHFDAAAPDTATELGLGHLWEFYIPVEADSGEIGAVFEVYHRAGELHSILRSARNAVWWSIGSGLSILLVFLLALVAANFRLVDRRRREAERLFADLAHAQEEERIRIMGYLHDEVGQPLYRVLYGIEGARALVDPDQPLADELDRAVELVRTIDTTLRSELAMLHQGAIEELELGALLKQLVNDVRRETSLEVDLILGEHEPLPVPARAALFRAAREAVTNVRRHAGASRVTIELEQHRGWVSLTVADDGSGLTGETGLGLATTQSRLEAIGGGLRVGNARSGGTRFTAWLPGAEVTR